MFCEFPSVVALMGGMIQPDRAPFCSAGTIGVFWVGQPLHPQRVVKLIEEILASRRDRLDLRTDPSRSQGYVALES